MIYLLGVDHKIQHDGLCGPKPEQTEMFKIAVVKIIEDLSIEVLVEEFNEEAKKGSFVEYTVVEKISKEHNKKHIFCEPSKEERKRNGILTRSQVIDGLGYEELRLTSEQEILVNKEIFKYFSVREALWYDIIKDELESKVLCVIGASHIPTFSSLLKDKKHECEVISENWCLENLS